MSIWTTVDSPLGPLTLVASDDGLTHVYFPTESPELDAVPQSPRATAAARSACVPERVLCSATKQLIEYFGGTRHHFDVQLALPTPPLSFHDRAHRALGLIPYGHRWSYAHLAQAAGSPRAVRAAGSACASNPLPIVVPCHRVVRADGLIGSYRGGAEAKAFLLEHEEHHARMAQSGNR